MTLWSRGLIFSAGVLAIASIAIAADKHKNAQIVGTVDYVIDGDTIVIRSQHLRLYGIDAPETKQECFRTSPQPQIQAWAHAYSVTTWPCGAVAAAVRWASRGGNSSKGTWPRWTLNARACGTFGCEN